MITDFSTSNCGIDIKWVKLLKEMETKMSISRLIHTFIQFFFSLS